MDIEYLLFLQRLREGVQEKRRLMERGIFFGEECNKSEGLAV